MCDKMLCGFVMRLPSRVHHALIWLACLVVAEVRRPGAAERDPANMLKCFAKGGVARSIFRSIIVAAIHFHVRGANACEVLGVGRLMSLGRTPSIIESGVNQPDLRVDYAQ